MTILKSIIKENEKKSTEKYFQHLIKDFYYLQHRLYIEFCIDKFIYIKFLNIC